VAFHRWPPGLIGVVEDYLPNRWSHAVLILDASGEFGSRVRVIDLRPEVHPPGQLCPVTDEEMARCHLTSPVCPAHVAVHVFGGDRKRVTMDGHGGVHVVSKDTLHTWRAGQTDWVNHEMHVDGKDPVESASFTTKEEIGALVGCQGTPHQLYAQFNYGASRSLLYAINVSTGTATHIPEPAVQQDMIWDMFATDPVTGWLYCVATTMTGVATKAELVGYNMVRGAWMPPLLSPVTTVYHEDTDVRTMFPLPPRMCPPGHPNLIAIFTGPERLDNPHTHMWVFSPACGRTYPFIGFRDVFGEAYEVHTRADRLLRTCRNPFRDSPGITLWAALDTDSMDWRPTIISPADTTHHVYTVRPTASIVWWDLFLLSETQVLVP
jgi:hypothetical protein